MDSGSSSGDRKEDKFRMYLNCRTGNLLLKEWMCGVRKREEARIIPRLWFGHHWGG